MRFDSKTRFGLAFVAIGGLALSMSMGAACVQQPTSLGTGGSGAGVGGGGGNSSGNGGTSVVANQAKMLFEEMEADLYMACGPGCHEAGGIADAPFLSGPDRYQSVISWPGIITKDPANSKLETIPVSSNPAHSFKFLDTAPLKTTLYPKVKAWLAAEAQGIVTEGDAGSAGNPYITPFAPIMGFNAVYLAPLGKEYTGMAITFNAALIDSTVLELTELEVHPTSTTGVHIVHPLFAVNPVGKSPQIDPVDSFSNVDQRFDPGQSGALGPGTLILTNWETNAKLSIGFEKVEPLSDSTGDAGADGGTTTGGCKDVAEFQASAQGPFKNNCTACHGGGNGSAKGALDMSQIDSDPAAACGQIKNRVKPADPPSSQIFITTDPNGNAAHPYKFGGSTNNFNAFKSSVSKWIQAEQ